MTDLSLVADRPAHRTPASSESEEALLAVRSGSHLTLVGIAIVAAALILNQIGPAADRVSVPLSIWIVTGLAVGFQLGGAIALEVDRDALLARLSARVLHWVLWTSTCSMAASLALGIVLVPSSTPILALMEMMLVVYAGYFYKRTFAITAIAWCVISYLGATAAADFAPGPFAAGTASFIIPAVAAMLAAGAFVATVRRSRDRLEQDARIVATIGLAHALDLRDAYTAEHSETVSGYAVAMARELRLGAHRVERLRLAGMLHDVGKIGIPDAVLLKPAKLTEAEWELMRRHPEMGAEMLDSVSLRDIQRWVLAHHERPDGRGYPAGLSGDDIPLEARILAVADAFEAMTADRVYRAGMPVEDAIAELRRCAGTQFDPMVVDAFLATVERAAASGRRDLAA